MPSTWPWRHVVRQPQGVLDLVEVAVGVAGQVGGAAAGEHGQAVDVVDGQAGVGHGGEHGVERQLEAGPVELPADGRLAHAADDGPEAQRSRASEARHRRRRRVRVRSRRATVMPIAGCRRPGTGPVTRTPGWSGNSTSTTA